MSSRRTILKPNRSAIAVGTAGTGGDAGAGVAEDGGP